MYHSIDDERDNASIGVMTLYDAHFQVVGMWSERNGRAMLGDAFYVREDADTGRERERNNERDCAPNQIDCRTYQTAGNSTRQSATFAI